MSQDTLLFTVLPVVFILVALWRANPPGLAMRMSAMVVTTVILCRLTGGVHGTAANLILFAGVVVAALYHSGFLREA